MEQKGKSAESHVFAISFTFPQFAFCLVFFPLFPSSPDLRETNHFKDRKGRSHVIQEIFPQWRGG